MNFKPFASTTFCSRCGAPLLKIGLSIQTKAGNFSVAPPIFCMNCKTKKKARESNER